MRPLAAAVGSIAVFALGGLVGLVPAASGNGQGSSCPPSTSTNPYSIAPTIPQPTGDPLNNVTVENCQNSTLRADTRLQVAAPHGSNPGAVNFAYAYAHDCSSGCEAIAAAFQVALIPQGSQTQAPQNVALAINYSCHRCAVFAYAYQYAVNVPQGTRLPGGTRHQIAMIRRQVDADVEADLPFATLDAKLQALAAQLRATVDQGLQNQNVAAAHRRSSQHVRTSGHG